MARVVEGMSTDPSQRLLYLKSMSRFGAFFMCPFLLEPLVLLLLQLGGFVSPRASQCCVIDTPLMANYALCATCLTQSLFPRSTVRISYPIERRGLMMPVCPQWTMSYVL